ncbi:MAG: enolase C-terminal domain-like protein [Actinomycetota bacterium]|nr:enolase C-terminal domain-like protein [Actinomycetota bacterium]
MRSTKTAIDRISAWAIDLPMNRTFVSARSVLRTRRLVLVKLEAKGHVGWGEVAPVPGHSIEDFSAVWSGIQTAATELLASHRISIEGPAAAAILQATADVAARAAGLPLSRHLGGHNDVWASAAIGTDAEGHPDRDLLEQVAAQGYRYAKLKITGATKTTWLRDIAADFPYITMGLDANGSLDLGDPSALAALDGLGFAFIEQPGPAADLPGHRWLKETIATPLSLDESAHSALAVEQIVDHGAADIINLKAGRFGTTETLALAQRVTAAGYQVRLGGLVESGIGRSHNIALAGRDEFSVVGDIAGSDVYFDNDLVDPPWRVVDGRLEPTDVPGIGVTVNEAAIERLAFDSFRRR